jgi:hypothetical protein
MVTISVGAVSPAKKCMRLGATVMILLSLLLPGRTGAQDAQPSEYQVKAAFIFNFAKFVEWPAGVFADAKSPLIIGIFGENPFGEDMERAVRNKTLNQRSITVKLCRTEEEARKCHVLFISASEKKRLQEILNVVGRTNILTVSETEGFVEGGGMINFFREGNKIRFQIEDETAKKAGLKIDSKLLGLAKKPA